MTDFLHDFARHFASLDAGNLQQRLGELYGHAVHFQDPLHEVHGLPAVQDYFAQLYANVLELRFDFHGQDQVGAHEGYLRWTMHYRHPRLRGGAALSLEGCSHLRWSDRVDYHRDYFDAGALLYEHVPLLGGAVRWLKGRLV